MFTLTASLLQLRGVTPVTTPIVSPPLYLAFNGEIMGGLPRDFSVTGNDGVALASALHEALDQHHDDNKGDDDVDDAVNREVVKVLGDLEGPWSMVFYDAYRHRLWFGRDVFGRRSLILRATSDTFILGSVSTSSSIDDGGDDDGVVVEVEVPPGIYSISLAEECPIRDVQHHPFPPHVRMILDWEVGALAENGDIQEEPGKDEDDEGELVLDPSTLLVLHALRDAVAECVTFISDRTHIVPMPPSDDHDYHDKHSLDGHRHLRTSSPLPPPSRRPPTPTSVPLLLPPSPVLILFSGGVDSTILAALAADVLPVGTPIDLINVCFGTIDDPSPDRLAALDALEELRARNPQGTSQDRKVVLKPQKRKNREEVRRSICIRTPTLPRKSSRGAAFLFHRMESFLSRLIRPPSFFLHP